MNLDERVRGRCNADTQPHPTEECDAFEPDVASVARCEVSRLRVRPAGCGTERKGLPSQGTVEDQAVTLVVVDDGSTLVRVVVGALHDCAPVGLDCLGGTIDVVGLDADDDLAR